MHGATSNKIDPLAIALLEVTRPMMIVAALYARRPSLMAHPDWSAAAICMLNDHHPTSHRLALSHLLDALAQIPALYHEQDALLSRRSTNSLSQSSSDIKGRAGSTSIQTLLSRSLSLRDDIYVQFTYWTASNPYFEFPSVPGIITTSITPYPCKERICFPSLQAADVFTFYNAIVILINQLVISSLLLLPSSDVHVLTRAAALERTSAAITQIIKSIDFQLTSSVLSDTSNKSLQTPVADAPEPRHFYQLFPIRAAHRVLSQSQSLQDVAKRLWLEGALCMITDSAGTWMSNDNIFGAGRP